MNAEKFMSLRRSGAFSGDSVTVWVQEVAPRDGDVAIASADAKLVDVRAFAGLPVFVHAQSYTPALVAIVDRIAAVTDFVFVAIANFAEELGWKVVAGEIVPL